MTGAVFLLPLVVNCCVAAAPAHAGIVDGLAGLRLWLDAEDIDGQANSWVAVTLIRSKPRPSVDLLLRRSDRWVDREAGY